LKIDLHVHTRYSYDASITPKELVTHAKKRGLDGVAITDHNTVAGLREFSKVEGLLIVPGVEIKAKQGHVLALNINSFVRAGLSFAETVDKIHDEGGLAIIAHPTAFFKGISNKQLDQNFDAIEVINSSAIPFAYSVRRNLEIAATLKLPQTAGSDAHQASEVGMAYTGVEAEKSVEDVVGAIKKGAVTPFGTSIPWGDRLRRFFMRKEKSE
jgi:predicted metal-dependent phosphoesterase TrpH